MVKRREKKATSFPSWDLMNQKEKKKRCASFFCELQPCQIWRVCINPDNFISVIRGLISHS